MYKMSKDDLINIQWSDIQEEEDPEVPIVIKIMTSMLIGIIISCLVVIFTSRAFAANQAPTIQLFPTTVVENIKQTGETAKAMEKNLQGIISDLEQQMAIYKESRCESGEGDEGCSQIAARMGEKYLEMLGQMESQLPAMEASVKVTRDSLEKRLRQELGKKMTPRDLQKMLSGSKLSVQPTQDKVRTGRLSDKFRQYYKLVALGSKSGSSGSLAAVASEIYLDSQEVLDLIALTRDEVGRAKLLIELNQMYGLITPEMYEMVSGVKSVIFGESNEDAGIPGPPPGTLVTEYKSPLEM